MKRIVTMLSIVMTARPKKAKADGWLLAMAEEQSKTEARRTDDTPRVCKQDKH